MKNKWKVGFTGKAAKQASKLPKRERDTLAALVGDMQLRGAVLTDWPNYIRVWAENVINVI